MVEIRLILTFSWLNSRSSYLAGFIGSPDVVILEEPFANLDTTAQIRLKLIIKELATKEEVTVLLSSQDLMNITEVYKRTGVLEKGEIG